MKKPHKRKNLLILTLLVCLTFLLFSLQSYTTISIRQRCNGESPRLFPCDDKSPRRFYATRGPSYYVLHNYFIASKSFQCDKSITFTTHSEWTYLDNLLPLLERWMGPISVSVYCPGDDFDEALKRILYLRECTTPSLIKELVTFHMIFDIEHFPTTKIPQDPHQIAVNCQAIPFEISSDMTITTRKRMGLLYPINIARNVARENALTHFVFASDIELYPSPGLIPDFLDMIRRNDRELQISNHKVFVSSIFELHENVTKLPTTKQTIIEMLKTGLAVPFHKHTCPVCHNIPKAKEWSEAQIEPGLRTFHIGKRLGKFRSWEPIFIGTNDDPVYDERLSWEGRKDKMTQGFVMCLLDYDFHILDNAFLVHRPGIKRTASGTMEMGGQSKLIQEKIVPELELLYGNGTKSHGCVA